MSSQGETFDLAIVGGGTGGYVAAIRASQLGMRVAVIEKDKLGGTCLHRGCIPTKALLESAKVYSLVRRGEEYGVRTSEVQLDYPRMLSRKDAIVGRLHTGVQYLMKKNKITVIEGRGQFVSPTTISVVQNDGQERQVEAKDVILATGSEPRGLPGLDIDGECILSSDHIIGLTQAPESLIIVGGGAIGSEFASFFNDIGTNVTIVEVMPHILPLEDAEIGRELEKVFKQRGIQVMTEAKLLSETMARKNGKIEINVQTGGEKATLSGDRMLLAVGRRGLVESLGLEKLQVQMERGYVKVDQSMSTSVPHLYAIGDVIGGMLLAHVAMAEGFVAVETIAGKKPEPLNYDRVPRVTYCRPEVGSIGLSEDEAKSKGHQVKVGRFPFRANGRAMIAGEPEGLVKIVADAESDEILGVHILGPEATELIMEPSLAKFLEATAWELGSSIHAHPTLAEAIGEAALAVDGQAIHI